ncbi:hypothetical protein [Streptomyces sp. MMBL 11-3]|uniref:hypothetical protein n=1 Tax=Streptomyces sp. MMBL 11-3 TaxID=3382639 RepID=UPI0039B66DC9
MRFAHLLAFGYVDVHTTGDLAGPRQVQLQIARDRADMEPDTRQDLPNRIADALVHASPRIGWTVSGELGPSLEVLLDETGPGHVELVDL